MGKSKIDMYTKYVNDFGFEDVNSFLTAGKSTQGLLVCEKANEMLGSWSGHAKHANSRNFIKSIIDKRPYVKLENNTLKINEEELYCYIETTKKTNGN